MATKIQVERRQVNAGLLQSINEIKELANKTHDIVTTMQTQEAVRAEREAQAINEVTELKKTVKGNGKLGLEKDVLILQQNESTRKMEEEKREKSKAEEERRRAGLTYTVAGAVIIEILLTILSQVF